MLETTLRYIKSHGPDDKRWLKIIAGIGKTEDDGEKVTLLQILENCGLLNAIWCLRCWPEHAGSWRTLFAWYHAMDLQVYISGHRTTMSPGKKIIDAANAFARHIKGDATDAELTAAVADAAGLMVLSSAADLMADEEDEERAAVFKAFMEERKKIFLEVVAMAEAAQEHMES
jgi:hypothetical protein